MFTVLTPWQLVAVTLAAGAAVGLALVWRLCAAEDRILSCGPTSADLTEAYARAIDHIKELQEETGRMDAGYVVREQARAELRAAELLGLLQAARAQPEPAAPARGPRVRRTPTGVAGWFAAHPKLVGGLWGIGLCALGGFLMSTVREGSVARPGAPVAAPAEAASSNPGIDKARFNALQEQLLANPDDVPCLLELAHMLLRVQMLEEAQVLNDRALKLDSRSLEGLTHAAVLAAGHGDQAAAHAGLKDVLRVDPGFAEAWFFRGMLSMQSGDTATMQESLSQFVRYAPDGPQKERVRAMLERSVSKP